MRRPARRTPPRRRRKTMKHRVQFTVPERELGTTDVFFDVRKYGRTLGTLKISRGALVWIPRDSKRYEFRLGWTKFAKLASAEGRRGKIPFQAD